MREASLSAASSPRRHRARPYLQRQALRRLIDAFAAGEIRFAAANLTTQLTSAAAG
jgi:hypothetical protein